MTAPPDDPLLRHLISLTREGTVVAAFQAAHDKFHRYHADCSRLAVRATTDAEALDELRQTLDAYTALFNDITMLRITTSSPPYSRPSPDSTQSLVNC